MTIELPERSNGKATDSPWFWIYLFSTFALIGLVVMQAKFISRQTAIERKGLGRRIMLEQQAGQDSQQEITTESTNQRLQTVSLRPLILFLAIGVCVGWIVFWSQRLRKKQLEPQAPEETAAKADDL